MSDGKSPSLSYQSDSSVAIAASGMESLLGTLKMNPFDIGRLHQRLTHCRAEGGVSRDDVPISAPDDAMTTPTTGHSMEFLNYPSLNTRSLGTLLSYICNGGT